MSVLRRAREARGDRVPVMREGSPRAVSSRRTGQRRRSTIRQQGGIRGMEEGSSDPGAVMRRLLSAAWLLAVFVIACTTRLIPQAEHVRVTRLQTLCRLI